MPTITPTPTAQLNTPHHTSLLMTLDEVLYDYYPAEGALLISHLLTDTELVARWNEKLDSAEMSSPKVIEVLGEEYLQNGGYRHPIHVAEDDEEAVSPYVNNGYCRLAALRRLVEDSVITPENALVSVSSNRDAMEVSTTSEPAVFHAVDKDSPYALVSFDSAEISFVDVDFTLKDDEADYEETGEGENSGVSLAMKQRKAEKAVFDEPLPGKSNFYDHVHSFRLNEDIWVSMATGSFDRRSLAGSLLLELDYNANTQAAKYNERVINELLEALRTFSGRVHADYGNSMKFSLGDLSEVFGDGNESGKETADNTNLRGE